MSIIDLMYRESSIQAFGESSTINSIESLESRVNDLLQDDPDVAGESFNIGPKPKSSKSILETINELGAKIKELTESGDTRNARRLKNAKTALHAKLESRKFIMAEKLKFKWKKNVPYLVFHKGKTIFGKAISIFTFSPFSHVDIVINGKAYTAYTENGVQEYDIPDASEICIYELSDLFPVKKIFDFFKKTEGSKYGFDRIMRSLVFQRSKKEKEDYDRFFCSHWVISALDYASGKNLLYEGQKLLSYGYDLFTPMRVFDFMVNSDNIAKDKFSKVNSLKNHLPKGASEGYRGIGEYYFPYGEADEGDIPTGEIDESGPVEESPVDAGGGGDYDDSGYEDFTDETENEADADTIPDPLADVDDSEKSLVRDLRENMATFYRKREADLEKILSSNISSSEYGEDIEKLIDKYKTTLTLFKDHLREGFYEGSVVSKTLTFVEYKAVFNQLNKLLNKYFTELGSEDEVGE